MPYTLRMEKIPDAPSQDLEHLKLLAIFHYILAGLTALFASFPLLHVVMGFLIATGKMGQGSREGHVPDEVVGWFFVAFGCAFVAAGWTLAGLMFAAGRAISKRRRHTFCLVVAGLSCLIMPFGTVLGVFTIIVLIRPQVKALFEAPPAS